jgi:general secretion pathway protein H
MVAALVAIAMPRLPTSTSRPILQGYAVEIAALLKRDRSFALMRHASIDAVIQAEERIVRSGSSNRYVRVPDDVAFDSLLPDHCNGRPALSSISFFSSGMSCGGTIRLTRLDSAYEVRVNWLTGAIDIVAQIVP